MNISCCTYFHVQEAGLCPAAYAVLAGSWHTADKFPLLLTNLWLLKGRETRGCANATCRRWSALWKYEVFLRSHAQLSKSTAEVSGCELCILVFPMFGLSLVFREHWASPAGNETPFRTSSTQSQSSACHWSFTCGISYVHVVHVRGSGSREDQEWCWQNTKDVQWSLADYIPVKQANRCATAGSERLLLQRWSFSCVAVVRLRWHCSAHEDSAALEIRF